MGIIQDAISQMNSSLKGQRFSPAYIERAFIASKVFRSSSEFTDQSIPRSVAAPFYSTDLGVRKSDDILLFYITHCHIAGCKPISSADIINTLGQTVTQHFGNFVDAFLLFTGDYFSISSAIRQNSPRLLRDGDYSCLIQCGVVLAAVGEPASLQFFDQASCQATEAELKYTAQHRAAATEIKRLNKPREAIARLLKARNGYLNDDDVSDKIELALFYNLYALALTKISSDESPETALESSSANLNEALKNPALNPVRRDMASRYASQVAINRAQLEVAAGNYYSAKKALSDNLSYILKNAPDYISEADSEYAYVCFLNNDFSSALLWAVQGFLRFFYIGDISGMRTCRKIISASLFEVGRQTEADKIAALVESDPLGLDNFGGVLEEFSI